MEMLDRFQAFWKEKIRLPGNAPVLLAVSGGLDSMTLAKLLHLSGHPLAVAHCNFGLRGADSDADEAFVQSCAAGLGVPFHTIRFDTKAEMAAHKTGTQATARALRYAWFESIRQEYGYARIATAHHAGDNAETVLLNLIRGTGIAGLHGILPHAGKVIRPLLFATREEITAFAQQEGIAFREDASNQTDDYRRNALRHHVLPAVTALQPDAVRQIGATATRLADAEVLYGKTVDRERKRLLEARGPDWYLPVRKLLRTEALPTILYELFKPFGFSAKAIAGIEALLHAGSGRMLESATHRVVRHRDFLVVTTSEPGTAALHSFADLPATAEAGGYRYRFSRLENGAPHSADPDVEIIDASLLEAPLVLRPLRAGDYFYPLGMAKKKKKVARFLTDGKRSAVEKSRVWVLESGRRIVWVCGYRVDERFKTTAATTQFVKLERRAV